MSSPIIEVERLSKAYRLRQRDDSLLRSLAQRLRRGGANGAAGEPEGPRLVWALRDVSFAVQPGEAVGIIGANGAGKSTLLKILSRLAEPTEGRVTVRGRIGSMLELGVGFSPDLTGRENVYLSGVILGIGRREIRRRFDEIVDFSGVSEFVDQPVKHFSSGMRMRLAFSVMVTLEPEVLLIDEVLGVGDEAFRHRSTQRMEELIDGGRTVLFVSHNQRAVGDLCDWTMQLDRGRVVERGATARVVRQYVEAQVEKDKPVARGHAELGPAPEKAMCLRAASIVDESGNVAQTIELSRPFRVRLRYQVNQAIESAQVFCRVETGEGLTVLGSGDADIDHARLGTRRPGTYTAEFEVPGGLLEANLYRITVGMGVPFHKLLERQEGVVYFTVVDQSSRRRLWYQQTRPGLFGQELPWRYDAEPCAG